MKNKKGFTLVELLVVVLIIGILASVALPQYQVAVLKSRLASTMSGVKTLASAAEIYYDENNGQYAPDDVQVLDVDFSDCTQQDMGRSLCGKIKYDYNAGDGAQSGQRWHSSNKIDHVQGIVSSQTFVPDVDNTGVQVVYVQMLQHSPLAPGKRFCIAFDNSKTSHQVCKSLGGVLGTSGLAAATIESFATGTTANNLYTLP